MCWSTVRGSFTVTCLLHLSWLMFLRHTGNIIVIGQLVTTQAGWWLIYEQKYLPFSDDMLERTASQQITKMMLTEVI